MRLKGLSILSVGLFCLALPQIANAQVGAWEIMTPTEGSSVDDNATIPVHGSGGGVLNEWARVEIFRKTLINGNTTWSYVTFGEKKVDLFDRWDISLVPPGGTWTTSYPFTEYQLRLYKKVTGSGDYVATGSKVTIKILTTGGTPGSGGT